MGQSIFNLISPEDVDRFRMYINPNSDMSEADWRKYFNIHIKRAGPRNESPVYELVNIMGMQRPTSNNGTLVNGRDVAPTSNNNDVSSKLVYTSRYPKSLQVNLLICIIDSLLIHFNGKTSEL